MSADLDVVVSGASYAGLSLALALRQASNGELRLAVLDGGPRPAPGPDPRAFALAAASVRLLEVLGIWQRVAGEAEPVVAIEITDCLPDSPVRQPLLRFDNLTGDGEPASHILPGERLRLAVEAAAAEAGIERIAGAIEDRDLSPAACGLRLAGGRRLTASLVVAAEGRRSALRELAGLKTVGWSYPQSAIVTIVRHERPHGGRAVQHFLPAGPFAMLPLAGGHQTSLVWSEERGEAERVMGLDEAGFLAELAARFGARLGELALAGPRMAVPLEMHLSRRLVAERLALLGDTARGVHPLAGQGLNLGLRDVAALTEVVVEAHRLGLDIGASEPLRRYERWRRFDSLASAAAMDGLNRLFSNGNPLLRAGRDIGLALVERSPRLKHWLVEEAAGLTGDVPRLLAGELP